jgi:hypothetical protein
MASLRFWPQKRWKQVLFVIFLVIVVGILALVGTLGVAFVIGSRDVVSEIDVINPSGNKTALLVYQPGLSSLPKDVSYAFAEGLASSGWRVEITTASTEAPSDMSNYHLLVLLWPNYGGTAGAATVRYVDRVNNLQRIQTVLIATGGNPVGAFDAMTQKVQTANGVVISSLAPNEGNENATEIAQQAGTQIHP